jgi:hypothetical protein
MKRLDDGKVSLVDFLRSIKFNHGRSAAQSYEVPTQLANFSPRARPGGQPAAEDTQLIRSAN